MTRRLKAFIPLEVASPRSSGLAPSARARLLTGLIPAGSIILGGTTLASYVLGLLRDRTFAQTFGASRALDAYNAAFLLPDLLFNILIASGIAAAVVPIFTELNRQDKEKAHEYTNTIITGATGTMIFVSVLMIIFAGSISHIVAPGLDKQGEKMVTDITRILALSPILFGISNTIGAVLIARRRFLFYGLSPVFYNLGIIGGTIILSPTMGIMGTAIGTLTGASAHLLIRLVDAIRTGLTLGINYNFKTPEFKKTLKLMLPKMLGHPVELITFWGFTVIASSLGTGAIAVMNFARNFESVPVSLIGITLSTTAFPALAEAIAGNSQGEYKRVLKNSFWLILGGGVLAAIITFIIREPLIRLVLGGGAFNEEAIKTTAFVLGVFTLAMPTESLVHLLARAFYATKNTVVPVVMSIIGLIISIGGAYFLAPTMGIIAIPLSFFVASFVEVILLMILLPRRLRKIMISPVQISS